MARYCSKCGAANGDSAAFCARCGKSLGQAGGKSFTGGITGSARQWMNGTAYAEKLCLGMLVTVILSFLTNLFIPFASVPEGMEDLMNMASGISGSDALDPTLSLIECLSLFFEEALNAGIGVVIFVVIFVLLTVATFGLALWMIVKKSHKAFIGVLVYFVWMCILFAFKQLFVQDTRDFSYEIVGISWWLPLLLGGAGLALAVMYAKETAGRPIIATPPTPRPVRPDKAAAHGRVLSDDQHSQRSLTGGSLRVLTGCYAGCVFHLRPGEELVVGRNAQESHLVIAEADISRKHCAICYAASERAYYVTDYSSTGTILNESIRLPRGIPYRCQSGSRLSLGKGNNVLQLK